MKERGKMKPHRKKTEKLGSNISRYIKLLISPKKDKK